MIKFLFATLLILVACQGQEEAGSALNLRVATDPTLPPFSSLEGESGAPVGLDMDILAAVAAAVPFAYEIVQAPWNDLFEQVNTNQVDLAISGITITDARKEAYDFSVPYFVTTVKILALQGTDIVTAQDLVNKVVGVRDGTTGADAVVGIFGGDNPNIKRYADQNQAIQALNAGEIAAYVDDDGLLEYYANNNAGFVVIEDANAFAPEYYGLMFPKGSELRPAINDAITALLENGEYATIYSKWFTGAPDVDALLEAGQEDSGENEECEWMNEEADWEWDDAVLL